MLLILSTESISSEEYNWLQYYFMSSDASQASETMRWRDVQLAPVLFMSSTESLASEEYNWLEY